MTTDDKSAGIHFHTPYPDVAVAANEFAAGTDSEDMVCHCGNSAGANGFSAADRNGRLADITAGPPTGELAELPDDPFSICNSCGRVIDSDSTAQGFRILGRVDVLSAEWIAARDEYQTTNFDS
tara:strand:+ start:16875 stop:17246 length:372 start_codon:yes stop_codon:yes gene_type:complete